MVRAAISPGRMNETSVSDVQGWHGLFEVSNLV